MFLVDFEIWCIRPAIRNVHFTVILVLNHSGKKIKYSQKLNFFVAKLRNKQYMNMFLHVIGVSTLIFVLSTDICKGLFTWRWGILGRGGNPLRWGNPPVNIWSLYLSCTYMNEMRDYMDRQVTSPTWDVPAPCK